MGYQKIDAHHHFWQFDPVRDNWISDDMSVIQKDFLPQDLEPLLRQSGFDGCVAVQSDQSEKENAFHLALAGDHDFIKGIVGWVDLQAENIAERLQHYGGYKKMKGFRHVLQGEAQRDFMLRPAFMNGIGHLNRHNFTYDILIFEDQLQYIPQFVSAFPDQPFVIDHLAKPAIKEGKIEEWKKGIVSVAQFQNVFCKISGMVTEADWKGWKDEDFKPYMDVVAEAFGPDRILFGSDWPVCLVAASYNEVVRIVADYFSSFTSDEQAKVFGGNAARFYNL
jgi:L-fuconolactonase